jgi:diguanylate cyclase (GGDEF)-like protein
VLVETSREEASQAGERVRSLVEDFSFRFETTPIRLTVSVGVATTSGDPDITPAKLLKQADDNLYQAKRSGRNRVCC